MYFLYIKLIPKRILNELLTLTSRYKVSHTWRSHLGLLPSAGVCMCLELLETHVPVMWGGIIIVTGSGKIPSKVEILL